MLKFFFIGLICFFGTPDARQQEKSGAKDITALVSEMRIYFFLGVENEDELTKLESLILNNFGKDEKAYPPKILAYAGGLDALKAKHTLNPFSKLSYTLSGLEKLDNAVEKKTENLEIRFLRFVILDNLPGVFGIAGDREADLNKIYQLLIKEEYTELNREVQQIIAEYMLESKRLNEKQEKSLRKLFPELTS